MTPKQLFLWAKKNVNGVTMYYVTKKDIITHERKYDLKVLQWSANCTWYTQLSLCYSRRRFSYNEENSSDTINDVHKFNDPKLQ